MSKAQEVFETVNSLVEQGSSKAKAFRTLAEKYGQPEHSIRGTYYGYKRKSEGGTAPRRTRKRETTPADAVESAVVALRRSIESIDQEIDAAKQRSEEAVKEYEAMLATADQRKKVIEEKIKMIEADEK